MRTLTAEALAGAFLDVGVWLALSLGIIAVVQHRTGGRFLDRLTRSPASARLGAALLGMVPGCGGAVVIVPLYLRGSVPFGAVVAALVATMGDSSFVLLATDLRAGLVVHVLLFAVGLASGTVIDRLGIDPRPRLQATRRPAPARSVGAAAAAPALLGRTALAFPSPAALVFWSLTGAGLLAVLVGSEGLVLGLAGTLLCVVVTVRSRHVDGCDRAAGTLGAALEEAARTAARLTTWVAAAYLVIAVALVGAEGYLSALGGLGLAGVAGGALVGLVPGCGAQVALTTMYGQGLLPFATLVANALSQDGDALFPLLAADRRAAVIVSALTLLPAIAVGVVVHHLLA